MTVPATREIPASLPQAATIIRQRRGDARAVDAFVLDANSRQALVFLRALGRLGIGCGAVESFPEVAAFRSRWCDVSAVVPDIGHAPDAFIEALIELLERYPARAIIPTADGSIEVLRAHRARIERHSRVAVGSEAALDVAVSKARTLAIAAELGIAIPRSMPVSDVSEVPAALREVGYPAVLKPLQSWVEKDGVGTRVVCAAVLNEDEAKRGVADVLQQGGSVVAQEWLPGAREAISFLYAGGTVWARFAQVAHRMNPPLGGSSVLRESISLPADAASGAECLIRTIGLEGYSEVEFRRDASGRPVLMEINPRLSASVEIAVRSGVNFPYLLYAWAAGEPIKQIVEYRTGIRMRWLGGDIRYLIETITHQGRPDVSPLPRAVSTFALDFLRPAAYDYIDLADLWPAWQAIWQTVQRPLRRIVTRTRK